MSTFEQFIRFTTDAVGLERTFRLLQSIVQIISSYPALLGLLVSFLGANTAGKPSYAQTLTILQALRQRLGLARRFFRIFRFLDTFNSAQKLYYGIESTAPSAGSSANRRPLWVHLESYMDVVGRTFNGMYLLLESSTIIDALRIEGLRVWTPEWEAIINIEAQRFWFLALVCSVISGLLKVLKVLAYTPVPPVGDVTQSEKISDNDAAVAEKASGGADGTSAEDEFDVKKEQERLRGLIQQTRKRRSLWRREVRAKLHGLGRSIVANSIDAILPGVIVGWVDVSPGTVGLAMFVTTVMTGLDVWERCGREVRERS